MNPLPDTPDNQQGRKLLATLFANATPGESSVLISTQRRKEDGSPAAWVEAAAIVTITEDPDEWLDEVDTRVAELLASDPHHDIYFCVTPRSTATLDARARRAEHTKEVTTLWADFDRATSSSAKNEDRAWSSWEEIAGWTWTHGIPEPSAVVESGNGWHLYWLLDEPLPWGANPPEAEDIVGRFGAYLMERATLAGKHLDNVFDPSRVLRLPGTMNWKPGWNQPHPVTLVNAVNTRTYSESEWDDLLPEYDPTAASDLGNWEYLAAQDIHDILTEMGTENDEEGEEFGRRMLAAIRESESGGRHASAYSVVARVVQQHPFKLDYPGLIEALGTVFRETKPDAERNEWRNLVTHIVSRRKAEWDRKDDSVIDITYLRRLEGSEEENEKQGLPLTHEWPTPVPIDASPIGHATPPTPFPVEALPHEMRRITEEVSRFVQADPSLPAIAAIGSISAASAGGFVIDLGWRETLSLYTVVSANPSERKSAVLRPFTAALMDATERFADSCSQEAREYDAMEKALTSAVKIAEKQVADNPDGYAEALSRLDTHESGKPPYLTRAHIIHSDVTQEKLIQHMAEMNGVAWLASAEGAFVSTIAGRYSSRGSDSIDLSIINSAYSGETIRSSRVGRGDTYVRNPHLTMTMFVQPTIAEKLRDPAFEGTGFISRILFSEPASYVGDRESGVRLGVNPAVQQAWDSRVAEVFQRGWGRQTDPTVLTVSPGARDHYDRWHAYAETQAPSDTWWGKAHGHLARVAAILHLASGEQGTEVGTETMERAVEVMRYFAAEHARLRGGLDPEAIIAHEVASLEARMLSWFVRNWPHEEPVSTRAVQRGLKISRDENHATIDSLVAKGWLAESDDRNRRDQRPVVPHPRLPEAAQGERHYSTWNLWTLEPTIRQSGQTVPTVEELGTETPPTVPTVEESPINRGFGTTTTTTTTYGVPPHMGVTVDSRQEIGTRETDGARDDDLAGVLRGAAAAALAEPDVAADLKQYEGEPAGAGDTEPDASRVAEPVTQVSSTPIAVVSTGNPLGADAPPVIADDDPLKHQGCGGFLRKVPGRSPTCVRCGEVVE